MRLLSFRDPLEKTSFDPGGVIFATSVLMSALLKSKRQNLSVKTEHYWLVEVNLIPFD